MEFQHELIIPNEGLPFKVFLFEGGNGNYVREKHWHTSIEIFAVLEGHLEFFMNKEEYPLKAGEQLIINSNEIHSIRAVEKNKTVVLQIPLKQFENYFTAQRFIRFRSQNETADVKLASLIKKLYKVTKAQVQEIAEMKMKDLNAASVEAAMSMIAGTARSMGIEVVD